MIEFDDIDKDAEPNKIDCRVSTLIELVSKSNCLSLHCPLTEETRHIINDSQLRVSQTT